MTRKHWKAWEKYAVLEKERTALRRLEMTVGKEPCLEQRIKEIDIEKWFYAGIIDKCQAKEEGRRVR